MKSLFETPRRNVLEGAERLRGSVERIAFHSEESGFCVLKVRIPRRSETATVVGKAPAVNPGEEIECEGEWVNDATYGLQFKANKLRVIPPSTLEGIERYLGSGMIRGIGPHFAHRLVERFGERVFEIIETEPERLLELDGIGPKRQGLVTDAWSEQKAIRDIMVFLQSHGVGTARAVRIHKTYGNDAIDRVSENPYRLALDIQGIGFITADAIARNLGIPRDSLIRARAGVHHILQQLASEGHCAGTRDEVIRRATELLAIDAQTVNQAVDLEVAEGNLVAETLSGEFALFLKPLHAAETSVAQHLLRLGGGSRPWGAVDPEKVVSWVERGEGLQLSSSQREALLRVLCGKVAVITGGPGVGKTTIVKSILNVIRARRCKVLLCAPTGRAAKRLAETTGSEAKTIHRLLEFDPSHFGFRRTAANPLDTDLLIVDEASMVDIVLMSQLLRALPDRAGLLLVGDVDQLPSVGPGTVLQDIIDSGVVDTVRLTEIFRQAASSRIVVNAHRINQGMSIEAPNRNGLEDFYFIGADSPTEIYDKLLQVVTTRIPKRFGLNPIRDIQVLTPMNRGSLGTRSLNIELQRHLNAGAEPSVSRLGWTYARGDKVLQTVNNYDKEVFNGDIGQITSIDPEEGTLQITFDDRTVGYEFGELDEVTLAYATSIHKSQGSEYPAVVIPLSSQHYTLLERNLLYTAVTRGKRLVVLIGQEKALNMAIRNANSKRRVTYLRSRLNSG